MSAPVPEIAVTDTHALTQTIGPFTKPDLLAALDLQREKFAFLLDVATRLGTSTRELIAELRWRHLVLRDRIGEVVPLANADAVALWAEQRAFAEHALR